MSANDIVSVSITVKDASANGPNFSSIMIVAKAPYAGSVRTYETNADGLAAMVTDGFALGSAAYLIVASMAAQRPTVSTVKIYGKSATNDRSVNLTPTNTTQGFTYRLTLTTNAGVSTDITYTNGGSESATTITTALKALVPAGITASGTTSMNLVPTTAGQWFSLSGVCRELTVDDATANTNLVATELTAAVAADPDFYGVIIDSVGGAEIASAGAWALTNGKLLVAVTQDDDVVGSGTSDVASVLKAAGNTHAMVVYSRAGGSLKRADASLLAREFSLAPGASTWAFKSLPGVTVDTLTTTEIANLRTKNANGYFATLGLPMTDSGKCASGRYTDITYGIDWLTSTIQVAVINSIVSQEKVDYTDVGIAIPEAALCGILDVAERDNHLIAPGWVVTTPTVASQLTADRANRIFRNLKFTATLSGAVQSVTINGSVAI